MDIARCTVGDLDNWAAMRVALWPGEISLRRTEAEAMLSLPASQAINLICSQNGTPIGFAEACLRHDYVNGCKTPPVAFLEGLYVAPAYRRSGVARALVERVAQWGHALGCSEFASDALLDNIDSHEFHAAVGFEETERVVYFRRPL